MDGYNMCVYVLSILHIDDNQIVYILSYIIVILWENAMTNSQCNELFFCCGCRHRHRLCPVLFAILGTIVVTMHIYTYAAYNATDAMGLILWPFAISFYI